jgi:ketosteroid isomerase-like protein
MTMNPGDILDFAERFVAALERGDAAEVRAFYAPDARIWHNTDGIEQTVDQNLKLLGWFVRNMTHRRYSVSRRVALEDGFLQQHALEVTRLDGQSCRLDACVVIRMADGVIVRLDEYIDSAQAAAIRGSHRQTATVAASIAGTAAASATAAPAAAAAELGPRR